jgi:hypothetical protein
MSEVCEKHGPYSTFCRECDLDTIEKYRGRAADPAPTADAGDMERLAREEAKQRFVHSIEGRSGFVQGALWFAALRPAPTEEQVERAADIATAVLAEELGNVGQAERLGQSVASAILAIGPALQAGAGR